jgi:hypothetical protein
VSQPELEREDWLIDVELEADEAAPSGLQLDASKVRLVAQAPGSEPLPGPELAPGASDGSVSAPGTEPADPGAPVQAGMGGREALAPADIREGDFPVSAVNIPAGDDGEVQFRFVGVPSATISSTLSRPLATPWDATLELDAGGGRVLRVPVARAATGDPGWLREGFSVGMQVQAGATLTTYGDRESQVSFDASAGPLLHWGGFWLVPALYLRIGTSTEVDDSAAAEGEAAEGEAAEEEKAPLTGDILSGIGGSLVLGYELPLADDLVARFGGGWRIATINRDTTESNALAHWALIEVDVGFRTWDPAPHFRAEGHSRYGIFFQFQQSLGSLSDVEEPKGFGITIGFAIRPQF